jgi:hypothetical protein
LIDEKLCLRIICFIGDIAAKAVFDVHDDFDGLEAHTPAKLGSYPLHSFLRNLQQAVDIRVLVFFLKQDVPLLHVGLADPPLLLHDMRGCVRHDE